jgi:hypothetical protein
MPLERKRRPIGSFYALQTSVEKRSMRGAYVLRQAVLLHRETVILARNHDSTRVELDDRMVRAVVPELHFLGLGSARKAE